MAETVVEEEEPLEGSDGEYEEVEGEGEWSYDTFPITTNTSHKMAVSASENYSMNCIFVINLKKKIN